MLSNNIIIVLVILLGAALWSVLQTTGDEQKITVSGMQPIVASTMRGDVKVAIIGSGIGGSSAAYFIRKHLGTRAEIHVYEQSTKVGGRLGVIDVGGNLFEAGGSIIHSSNRYMVRFINELGLKRKKVGGTGKFGIYNGDQFVFVESASGFITKLKMLWRYGFFSLWHLSVSLSNMLDKFMTIYEVQDEGIAYKSVPDMLRGIGGETFFDYTQKTAEEVMYENGIGKLLIEELVTAVTRNNYGQDTGVNAFTGYVSMAGSQGGSLFAVKGGNYRVPQHLLKLANATVYLNQHVSFIHKEKLGDGLVYFLNNKDGNIRKKMSNGNIVLLLDDHEQHAYDAVIVASPLEVPSSYIKCSTCSDWPDQDHLGKYQRTVATFVQSDINITHFGCTDKESAPTDIFTTESLANPFSSIGKQFNVYGTEVTPSVYKVFSRTKLKDNVVRDLFVANATTEHYTQIDWLAYPHYSPPERFSPFVLDDGIFYVNAIERAASAMEMSAIGGRNVALLTKNYFADRLRSS